MQNTKIFALIGLALMFTAFVADHTIARVRTSAPTPLDIDSFPRKVGNWVAGPDIAVDPRVYEAIPTAKLVQREYTNPSGQRVYMVIVTASRFMDFHDPRICFPAQGYALSNERTVHLENQSMEAMVATKGSDVQNVLWWLGGKKQTSETGLLNAIQRVRNKIVGTDGQSLFIRLTADAGQDPSVLATFAHVVQEPLRELAEKKH